MVFPPVPVYLDHSNWQQQQNHQQGSSNDNLHLQPEGPPHAATSGGAGSTRPGSMAERARLAKVPQPEAALNCPRCDSTNTKFCYFNNYSLLQPRHFCKTCRRYWTRGGALRNVPVGGGCRRNKRSKGSSSKSSGTVERLSMASTSSSVPSSNSFASDIIGHLPPQAPQLPFMSSLHHLIDYNSADIGSNFGAIQSTAAVTPNTVSGSEMEYQTGSNSSSTSTMLSAGLGDHWRYTQAQQFPLLTGLELPPTMYPFEGNSAEPGFTGGASQLRLTPSSSGISQMASVKTEGNQGLNMSRQLMGIPGNDQLWGGGSSWSDLSGFGSSSTSHIL